MTSARLDPKHYLKFSQIQMGVAAELIAQIEWQGSERLLDVGAGDGKITAFLGELVGEVIGIDPCVNMVEFASNTFPHIQFERQSAEEMTFDAPFDVIMCLSALQWVRKPEKAFEQMAKALKPGGKAYILTYPAESVYWGPMHRAAHDPLFTPYLATLAHPYSAEQYSTMAEQKGLKVVACELQDHFATHDTFENVKAYIQGWQPCLIDLPLELRSPFIDLLAKHLMAQAVDLGDSQIHLPYSKLVLVLEKS